MGTSIDQARRDVQRAVQDLVGWTDGDRKDTFDGFERELWTQLLALGRLLVLLFLARQVARPRSARYTYEGREYVLSRKARRSELGTRMGKVAFTRPIGRQLGPWGRNRADLPIDRELGLCAGFSLGVVVAVTRLCALMAFATARATFREFSEWAPSPRATLRMVDAVGDEARPFLEQASLPTDDGEVLILLVDARGAPMINSVEYARRCVPHERVARDRRAQLRRRRRKNPRPRRGKGQKSKNAKAAFVGVIFTLRRTRHGLQGPLNKRLYATFESHRTLFEWLRSEADKRGYGRKRTIFLADGSEHIWRLQQELFPDAEPCVDWYHIVEKLWSAGECLHREGSEALKSWVGDQKRRLRRGKVGEVIDTLGAAYAAIGKTGPGTTKRRKRLLDVMKHLSEHQHRMRYGELRRDDLPIGSGAVEGAVRNLVGMRLDGPGMRWGRDRSEKVLRLRCILLNGQWDEFESYLSHRSLTLAAQPQRARTHDAEPHPVQAAA